MLFIGPCNLFVNFFAHPINIFFAQVLTIGGKYKRLRIELYLGEFIFTFYQDIASTTLEFIVHKTNIVIPTIDGKC